MMSCAWSSSTSARKLVYPENQRSRNRPHRVSEASGCPFLVPIVTRLSVTGELNFRFQCGPNSEVTHLIDHRVGAELWNPYDLVRSVSRPVCNTDTRHPEVLQGLVDVPLAVDV